MPRGDLSQGIAANANNYFLKHGRNPNPSLIQVLEQDSVALGRLKSINSIKSHYRML